jgi:hypothetical protein
LVKKNTTEQKLKTQCIPDNWGNARIVERHSSFGYLGDEVIFPTAFRPCAILPAACNPTHIPLLSLYIKKKL